MKKFILATSLCTFVTALFAQEPSAEDSLADYLSSSQVRPYIYAETSFGAMANSVTTSSMLDFGTRDFLEEEDKNALTAPVGSVLRYGLIREMSIGYRKPWKKVLDAYQMGSGFSIRNTYYSSASLSKDLLNLVLYGNKPYADQVLSLDGSQIETWYYTSLDYHFDILFDSVQPVSFTVSLHIGHDHSFYNVNQGQLYTQPEGEYLDLDLDYMLRENTTEAHPFAGFGLGLGGHTAFRLSDKEKLHVGFADVGVMQWNRGRLLETDSTFRFRGIHFDNVFAINDSLISHTNKSYTESFFYEEETSYTTMLPFYTNIAYERELDGSAFRKIYVGGDYRYLSGFYPRLRVATEIQTGSRQLLTAVLSTGGYTWFSLNAGYKVDLLHDWQLKLRVDNLNGLIVPSAFGGAIASINLQYKL